MRATPFRSPKHVFAFEHLPGHKSVEVSVDVNNMPGELEKITHLLSSHGVNILSGIHDVPAISKKGRWTFFADLTSSDITSTTLKENLAQISSEVEVGA